MSDYKLIDVTRLTKFKEKLLGILTYTSPAADATNTSIEFIDTVSQSNGKISASKKKVSVFTGATTTKAGTTGLVPASGTGDVGKFLKGDGTWDNPPNTTYSVYTYSTTSKAGTTGLVPQPGTNAVGKFLKGGSGWSDLPTASTTNSGIVSLSSSTNSDAENVAATPKAVKAVYAAASTAGANAASSYATAAKNSASNASTYATNAKNSADSAASAASTAVTNKINALTGSTTDSTETSTTFISDISQTKGVVTATKKSLPTASTKTAGIVALSNSTNGTSTTTAATPKAVNDAIKSLSYTDPTDGTATETSTTFISNISQSNGVISATKKKLPTVTYSAGQGIEIKNGVISVIPTMIGNPTCPDYTLYGDYFLSDIMNPNINWNDACKMKESVIVTQKYNYGANQTKIVYAKLLSKKDLETLTNNQRKINISGIAYDYYWTNTNYGASTNNAWTVYSRNGDILESSTNSTCCARLGFKNPFI